MKGIAWRTLVLVYVPTLSLLLATAAAPNFMPLSIGDLTSDATAVAQIHPLTGVVSNIGMLLWWTAVVACAVAWLSSVSPETSRWRGFLLASGLLSTMLLVDDLFRVHEFIAPVYLGVGETLVYAGYACTTLAYLAWFRRTLLATDYLWLARALVFFAGSVAVDLVPPGLWVSDYLLEDGLKLLGLANWAVYYLRTSIQVIRSGAGGTAPADAVVHYGRGAGGGADGELRGAMPSARHPRGHGR